ncbi:anaphase-promoting complex subunit Apc1 [Schizosaccharomyces japonicus yFS275]|uniref:Anaphase-promoting complex subunit Apc1 n=1 Tax=Schizosaccharomyces japonicus (strain yFS275 / FY16936) TaxID=402676 RepID=B6K6I1_SCHJY|nr:anaphase-promoting complex subunit Apc1 [Schizosaccharomyces japonicus yFS275]EEB09135.2 anaphase-promoting complex subunit Apc1 [Schizosaccharomyces japonicus yFS275]
MLELHATKIDDKFYEQQADFDETDRLEVEGTKVSYLKKGREYWNFDFSVEHQAIHATILCEFEPGTKSIVVLLEDIGYVFNLTENSSDYFIVNVPFTVKSVWNSPYGVLLERCLAKSEDTENPMPHIFCLTGPLEELSLVATEGKHKLKLCDSIVYNTENIVVTYSERDKRLSFWGCSAAEQNDHQLSSKLDKKKQAASGLLTGNDRCDSCFYGVNGNSNFLNKLDDQSLRTSVLFTHLESFPLAGAKHFNSITVNGVLVVTVMTPSTKKGIYDFISQSIFERVAVLSANGKVSLESPMSPSLTIAGTYVAMRVAGRSLLLTTEKNEERYLSIDIVSSSTLVQWCLATMRRILPVKAYEIIYTGFVYLLLKHEMNESEALDCSFLSCFLTFASVTKTDSESLEDCLFGHISFSKLISLSLQLKNLQDYTPLNNYLGHILICLHFVCEEMRLNSTLRLQKEHLAELLYQLAKWVKWQSYVQYYSADVTQPNPGYNVSMNISIDEPPVIPSIMQWLLTTLLSQKIQPFHGPQYFELSPKTMNLFPLMRSVLSFWDSLLNPDISITLLVEEMVQLGLQRKIINRFPEGLSAIFQTILSIAAENCPSSWESEELKLVNRLDIDSFLNGEPTPINSQNAEQETKEEIRNITTNVIDPSLVDSDVRSAESDFSALLFRNDKRMQEVEKLLSFTRQVTVSLESFNVGGRDVVTRQQNVVQSIVIRTISIPIGAGMMRFGSRDPLPTEVMVPQPFEYSVRFTPSKTIIQPEKEFFSKNITEWAEFHAGVALGLSVCKDSQEVNTSWIMFNRPDTLTTYHAGFLLGLGLNGHLKSLATWHSFVYLTSKHTLTSIGLLLGLSASYMGTMDAKITKLLSVHILALLPVDANELNLSPLTQTAGLLGIGLLYYGTCHRRMSEVTLNEVLCSTKNNDYHNEGYKLAAGFALGLINLGKGANLPGMADLQLAEKLHHRLTREYPNENLETSSPGAIMALTLLYLKTNDRVIAKKIDIPKSKYLLGFYRPDLLMLRITGKNLILWDEVRADYEWVKSQIPDIMLPQFDLKEKTILSSEDLMLYNVIAGICFSLGIRFAGTGNTMARDILLNFFDSFLRLCGIPAKTHDERVTYVTMIRSFRNLWVLAVERRCLIPVNRENGSPCVVPFKLVTVHQQVQKVEAPVLLPPFEELHSLESLSDKYWKFKVDFSKKRNVEQMKRSQVIALVPFTQSITEQGTLVLETKQDEANEYLQELLIDSLAFKENKSILSDVVNASTGMSQRHALQLSLQPSYDEDDRDQLVSIRILIQFFEACWTGVLANKMNGRQFSFLSQEFAEQLNIQLWQPFLNDDESSIVSH